MSTTAQPAPKERWPSQVKYILGNEAAERFSYYGMKGILAGFRADEKKAAGK